MSVYMLNHLICGNCNDPCCSVAQSCPTLSNPMDSMDPIDSIPATCQASLTFTNSQSQLKLMSIELVMLSNHLTLCCPLLLLPSIFPNIRVFSSNLALCIRWPKYWSFNFSVGPSNDYSGFISFRIDGFDLLAVQGTLKSFFQYHSLKASVLWCSAFFMVQLSHLYKTTEKTIALTIWTSVNKAF